MLKCIFHPQHQSHDHIKQNANTGCIFICIHALFAVEKLHFNWKYKANAGEYVQLAG